MAVRVGERCLICRVHYIKFGDEIKRTTAADLLAIFCRDCGLPRKLILSGYTQRERDVIVRVMTAEDRTTDHLTWLASYVWMHYLPRFLEIDEIGLTEEKRLRDAVNVDVNARRQVKILDELNAQEEKSKKAHEDRKRNNVIENDDTFASVIAVLDEIRKEQFRLDHTVFLYRVMAEMEVFIWGDKSAETLKLIEDRQRQLEEETAQRKREAEERDRKYQEDRRQREEERRKNEG
jgi:predicted RNA-binding protein